MAERKSFDRIADVYDATRALPADAQAAVTAGIVALLHERASAPRVLDVGIGTGRVAVPLAAAGVRIVGVDVAPQMLARLRAKRADIGVAIADAAALPFAVGRFDAVLFVHLLHLVSDPPAVIREAAAVVRRGGIILRGRTDHVASPLHDMVRVTDEVVNELVDVPSPTLDRQAVANEIFGRVAAEIGATLEERTLARWAERATAAEYLDTLARHVFSRSWSIPDAVMPDILRRLAPRLEALLGGLDAAVEIPASFTAIVARLPG